MNNLALISSPGQYYTLLEYLFIADLNKNDFYLIFFDNNLNPESTSFFNDINKQDQWGNISFFHYWKPKDNIVLKIFSFLKLIIFIQKIPPIKFCKLVCSQLDNNYILQIINSLYYEEVVNLDEGNAIYITIKKRKKNNKKKFFHYFGYKNYFPEKITFFTSYPNIEITNNDKILLCENDFAKDCLKNHPVDSDTLMIVGQPFVKIGFMSADKYYNYLLNIINQHSDIQEYHYSMHRNEDIKDVTFFCNQLGLKIVKNNLPIEMEIINMDVIPKYFIGFNSAALLNIRKILPKQIDVFAIRLYESDISVNYADSKFDEIYEVFKNNNIIIH